MEYKRFPSSVGRSVGRRTHRKTHANHRQREPPVSERLTNSAANREHYTRNVFRNCFYILFHICFQVHGSFGARLRRHNLSFYPRHFSGSLNRESARIAYKILQRLQRFLRRFTHCKVVDVTHWRWRGTETMPIHFDVIEPLRERDTHDTYIGTVWLFLCVGGVSAMQTSLCTAHARVQNACPHARPKATYARYILSAKTLSILQQFLVLCGQHVVVMHCQHTPHDSTIRCNVIYRSFVSF